MQYDEKLTNTGTILLLLSRKSQIILMTAKCCLTFISVISGQFAGAIVSPLKWHSKQIFYCLEYLW